MKKHYLWVGALALLIGTTVYAQDISIYVSDKIIKTDASPKIKEGITYAPISFISKELGGDVKWENLKPMFVLLNSITELLDCNVDYQKEINRINITHDNSKSLEVRMKEIGVMDYCVVDDWVYYVTLGDLEGFHKMSLDGTQDTRICDFSKVNYPINGSTSVTSEVKDGYIFYKFQGLRQYDANGKLEEPHPIACYRLNLFSLLLS
ncbi:MAG: stalk domain-containing protein [Cellulosilyticaceae bacterium]